MSDGMSYKLEVTWDRLEDRRALIAKLRAMLPAPMKCVRETADAVGYGLLAMSRSGLHIYDRPEHPVDYAPNNHAMFTVKEHFVDVPKAIAEVFSQIKPTDLRYQDAAFSIASFMAEAQYRVSRKIRCPNCGHTIVGVPVDIGPNDLFLVACENTNSYKFSTGSNYEIGTTNPHGPLVFEYCVSEWL